MTRSQAAHQSNALSKSRTRRAPRPVMVSRVVARSVTSDVVVVVVVVSVGVRPTSVCDGEGEGKQTEVRLKVL